jgi:prolyl-tRNA editing enzyme YbaK/EbsC (Cys-tRNA(Pro) deacylase)
MTLTTPLSPSAMRVQAALVATGVDALIIEYPVPARTALEAAQVLGCELGAITKSLIFRLQTSGEPLLVLTSGANRVDLNKVSQKVDDTLGKADAAFTRAVTGYAIGGIPPLGHVRPIRTVLDADLLQYAKVFPAGGTPNAMFAVAPQALVLATGAEVADIKEVKA